MNTVCAELNVPRPDMNLVLDLARDVAHGVVRPAAPLTAYLVGVAVGRGADPATAAAAVTAARQRLGPRARRYVRGSSRTMICLVDGVFEPSAVESSGTSTLASGK